MVDFDKGLLTGRAEAFDAFVQWTFGGDNYRLKGLQRITTEYTFNKIDKYNDEGNKVRVRDTYTHTASIEMVATADDFDTDIDPPPSDVKTISFFLDQKIRLHADVRLDVIEVFTTKAAVNPVLRHKFTMDVDTIGHIRQVGDTVMLTVSGEILDGQIETSITQPAMERTAS